MKTSIPTVFYHNPSNLPGELKAFDATVNSYLKGEIPKDIFKGKRVVFGVYEERGEESYMIRIRCSAGAITPLQLFKVADLSSRFGDFFFHITTRQELQLHKVNLKDVNVILNELLKFGLSTRGGGGNTIRNLLASHDSGICPEEAFDVSPHNLALCSMLISEADSWNLPRKFKIAFSNTDADSAGGRITCLGFLATVKKNTRGFKVYVAGGQGAHPTLGKMLEKFISEDEVYLVTKAIKNVFNRYGNRKHSRTRGKLKFLWEKLGEQKFFELYHAEKKKLLQSKNHSNRFKKLLEEFKSLKTLISIKKESHHLEMDPAFAEATEDFFEIDMKNKSILNDPFYQQWKFQFTKSQKQKSLMQIKVPLLLGDINNDFGKKLAKFLYPFMVDCLRFSSDQNVYLRNIPEDKLPQIFCFLKKNSPFSLKPAIVSNMVSCTGADTCKLGICLPREITPVIQKELEKSSLPGEEIKDIRIHISGCPNACGRHHVSDLGYYGKINRFQEKMYPAYALMLGGKITSPFASLAEKIAEIPARYVPEVTIKILRFYVNEKKDGECFHDFFIRKGKENFVKTLGLKDFFIPTYSESPNFYQDWNQNQDISVLKGQQPECAAGLFDVINIDKKIIEEILKKENKNELKSKSKELEKLLFHTCRMLLITRGLEAKEKKEIFAQFQLHFIESGIVSHDYLSLLKFSQKIEPLKFNDFEHTIKKLAGDVLKLYQSMDDSLRFPGEAEKESFIQKIGEAKKSNNEEFPIHFKDLRGIPCPMNFVKTKLTLSKLSQGDRLNILLDDGEPIINVPNSVEEEGHKILEKTPMDNHWRVLIKK